MNAEHPIRSGVPISEPLALGPESWTSWSLLTSFFVLTYVVTWTVFLVVGALVGRASPSVLQLMVLPGVFAPALVAITLTAWAEGRTALRHLLGRVLRWRVRWHWFLFAVVYMASIKLAVALVYRIGAGTWPRFGSTAWYVMVAAILISAPFQSGEEIGWRGFALPRLAARFGMAKASIVVGIIWAVWHLPLFFIRGSDTYGQSFAVYLLQVTALSVALAWLYVRSSQSLLLPMLMHAAVNNTKDIVPSSLPGATSPFGLNASPVAWLTVVCLWVCAVYFLMRMPRGRFTSD